MGKNCNPSWSSFCSGNTHKFKCSNYHKKRTGVLKGEDNDYKNIYQDHNYGEDMLTIRRNKNPLYHRLNNENDDSECKYIPNVGVGTRVETSLNRATSIAVPLAGKLGSTLLQGVGKAAWAAFATPRGGKTRKTKRTKKTRRKKHTRKQEEKNIQENKKKKIHKKTKKTYKKK